MIIKKVICIISLIFLLPCCNEKKVTAYVQLIFEPDRGMIYIPAGEFVMGSKNGSSNEDPEHTVYVGAFYIDENPITNSEYFIFWNQLNESDKDSQAPESFENIEWPDRTFFIPRHPVVGISWTMANNYARWAGKRLPTEAEWEKAAKGLSNRQYPWGNTPPEFEGKFRANFNTITFQKDGFSDTNPVGYYNGKNLNTKNGRSYYELNDMAGNVWEWVYDWYSENYYNISPYDNPVGPDFENSNKEKVIRGGSWKDEAEKLKTTYRKSKPFKNEENDLGFRCVLPAE